MNILIIGGTRFVGYYAAQALRDAGHAVTVFTRGRLKSDLHPEIRHLKGDRKVESDLRAAASAQNWDVVWDNMSYTAEDADAAVRVFSDECQLFVHTSTLAVYSVCEGITSPYREEDFERGRPLVDRRARYPYEYGIQRREGEQVLQQAFAAAGFPYVSVRLPAVIGPRDYSLRAWSYWRRILEDGRLILPDGGMEMHRSIYSGDVVAAIEAIIERGRELAGRAYNLAGREIVSLRQFAAMSAAALGREAELLDISRSALEAFGLDPEQLSPYTTWANHLHSIARAQHDFGFAPTPMEDWLAPTIEWHVQHRRDSDPPGWKLREREADIAERWTRFVTELEDGSR